MAPASWPPTRWLRGALAITTRTAPGILQNHVHVCTAYCSSILLNVLLRSSHQTSKRILTSSLFTYRVQSTLPKNSTRLELRAVQRSTITVRRLRARSRTWTWRAARTRSTSRSMARCSWRALSATRTPYWGNSCIRWRPRVTRPPRRPASGTTRRVAPVRPLMESDYVYLTSLSHLIRTCSDPELLQRHPAANGERILELQCERCLGPDDHHLVPSGFCSGRQWDCHCYMRGIQPKQRPIRGFWILQ